MSGPSHPSAILLATCLAAVGAAGIDAAGRAKLDGKTAAARPRLPGAKHVVLMIADGAGFNTWLAASLYQGTTGAEFYDGPGWVRLALSTYPLRAAADPPVAPELGTIQVPSFVYDPLRAWDPTPVAGGPDDRPWYFAGYKWLRETRPDSANTATALGTGQRTYNGGINVDGRGRRIERTLAALARSSGRRIGVVSDVPFAHATPAAAAGVHRRDRHAYCALAVEMLTAAGLDLIAGAGNPDFDNNGRRIDEPQRKEYRYVGGEPVWAMLSGRRELLRGERVCADEAAARGAHAVAGVVPHPGAGAAAGQAEDGSAGIVLDEARIAELKRWVLVQTTDEIAGLDRRSLPERLLVVPTVGQVVFPTGRTGEDGRAEIGATLQQQRGSRADPRFTPPGYDPLVGGVPTLATLSRLALDAVGHGGSGSFLMIEGGAIDWAMHENQLGRMIEETMAFKDAVRAVTGWIDERDGWGESLVVIVADHDHLLWGPAADTVPFDPLRDGGAGQLPGYRWLSDEHSNALVRLFARGAGSELFARAAERDDPFRGRYLDQTDVFRVLEAVLGTGATSSGSSGPAR